jgi:hypothetical protein
MEGEDVAARKVEDVTVREGDEPMKREQSQNEKGGGR